jgi:hypothetical protein
MAPIMARSEWIAGLLFVAVLAVLPIVGQRARRSAIRFCAFDGGQIDSLYRVRVVDAGGNDHEFCCIACAAQWLKRDGRAPRAVFVTDEIGGAELDAVDATFVRSLVVTNRTTGNRIHAFRSKTDAQHHAAAVGGRVLDASDQPFR